MRVEVVDTLEDLSAWVPVAGASPQIRASSTRDGFPAAATLDHDPDTCWRSEPAAGSHRLTVDFLAAGAASGMSEACRSAD
jgi:hypothetical protein